MGCIDFHTDGMYSSKTVQITLNGDETYKGGRLTFYAPDTGLDIPKRTAGTLTMHPRQMLHGVSRLEEGVRYSLFVVDSSNGLGEKDVYRIGAKDLEWLRVMRLRKMASQSQSNDRSREDDNEDESSNKRGRLSKEEDANEDGK